jgi:hypothetical protein
MYHGSHHRPQTKQWRSASCEFAADNAPPDANSVKTIVSPWIVVAVVVVYPDAGVILYRPASDWWLLLDDAPFLSPAHTFVQQTQTVDVGQTRRTIYRKRTAVTSAAAAQPAASCNPNKSAVDENLVNPLSRSKCQ